MTNQIKNATNPASCSRHEAGFVAINRRKEATKMKRKSDPTAAIVYNPAAANTRPIVQNAPAAVATDYAASTCTLKAASLQHILFLHLVHFRWRTGEYCAPDDCEVFMMGTTAILYPRKSDDPKEQQIQQHNYDNFINTMAQMIHKYAPQIQKLREERNNEQYL